MACDSCIDDNAPCHHGPVLTKPKIIIRNSDGHAQHDATGCFDIVIGDGLARLNVSLTRDGWVELRAMEGDLACRPRVNNALQVRPIPMFQDKAPVAPQQDTNQHQQDAGRPEAAL